MKNNEVRLSSLNRENAAVLFHWRNHPRIYKWCRQHDLINYESHLDWFERQAHDPTIKMFEIWSQGCKTLVGICGITSIDLINQRAEFSLYIDPNQQHKGFGKMALRTLITHVFDAYPLNLIYGEVFDGNPALEMFQAIGFKYEAVRREFYFRNGKFIDAHLISIKRGELKW